MKKCSLFQRKVNFLGHVLTESGIEVQKDKVKAIQNWPRPHTLTELRSFVGLCSYYRRFISEFASIAAPLHDLTRKNARFSWGSEQEVAFNQLKRCLISAPVLGMPRDSGAILFGYRRVRCWTGGSVVPGARRSRDSDSICVQNSVPDRTKL